MKPGQAFQVGAHSFLPVDVPDQCPHCQKYVNPIVQWKYAVPGAQDTEYRAIPKGLQLVVLCPNQECLNLYIVDFQLTQGVGTVNRPFHVKVKGYIPIVPLRLDFAERLEEISPYFPEIYNQAYAAEQYGLNEVAGAGYRKALEFLLKDFAILMHPDEAEEIGEASFRDVLRRWVSSRKVTSMAARAAWLGNDHTHYVRKWDDRTLEDLKALLRVVVNWVLLESETSEILSTMPRKR